MNPLLVEMKCSPGEYNRPELYMIYVSVLEIRIRNWSTVFEDSSFLQATDCCPIEFIWQIWLTKMDFGLPNDEIVWKMANG